MLTTAKADIGDVDVEDGFWYRKWAAGQREVMQIHLDSKAKTAKQLDAYIAKRMYTGPRHKGKDVARYVPVEDEE